MTRTITKSHFFTALMLSAIALQAADFLSTDWVLATGLGSEKNELILTIAEAIGTGTMPAVFVVKLIVAGVLVWALKTTKPTGWSVLAATGITGFYSMVVTLNLYWLAALTGLA
jgi:hypothetical protein